MSIFKSVLQTCTSPYISRSPSSINSSRLAPSIVVPKNMVESELDMALRNPPQCQCGNGIMILRKAGEFATRPMKYYYICPASLKHPKKFIWYDEYHGLHTMPNLEPTFTGSVSTGAPPTNFVNRKNVHTQPPFNASSNEAESSTSNIEHRSISASNILKHVQPAPKVTGEQICCCFGCFSSLLCVILLAILLIITSK